MWRLRARGRRLELTGAEVLVRMPRRHQRWVWGGRLAAVLVLAVVIGYWMTVGLDKADKLASCLGALLVLAALLAPYLLPAPAEGGAGMAQPDRVENSGAAIAADGGEANTGVQTTGRTGPVQVTGSGNAVALGADSIANTGIQHRPDSSS